jgi:hypothetical protein
LAIQKQAKGKKDKLLVPVTLIVTKLGAIIVAVAEFEAKDEEEDMKEGRGGGENGDFEGRW